jgi:hypothetical protein
LRSTALDESVPVTGAMAGPVAGAVAAATVVAEAASTSPEPAGCAPRASAIVPLELVELFVLDPHAATTNPSANASAHVATPMRVPMAELFVMAVLPVIVDPSAVTFGPATRVPRRT